MRLLLKLVMKLVGMVLMVVIMGSVMRHGSSYLMQVPGAPENPKFSSEEADLMSTVFKSALRLFSGSASRDELSSELSDKLRGGHGDAATMSELGIEMVKPGADPSAPGSVLGGATAPAAAKTGAQSPNSPLGAKLRAKQTARTSAGESPADRLAAGVQTDLLARIWGRAKFYSVELSLIPVMFLGMALVRRIRGRSSGPDFVPAMTAFQTPAESEPYDMKHPVHSLSTEEFELLVALIYQRQGYRVSMPSGLGGGRGGDFTLQRKSERLLVQCKRLNQEHRIPVERVRELHEAMVTAGLPRALYVVSCGFTWDARNFAKAKGITLINARTLDELLLAAREKPTENLLTLTDWAPKLLSRVQLTPPLCPACEAAMDEVNASNGSVWVCSQRPDCRGRRSARKYQKPARPTAAAATAAAEVPAENATV